MDILSLYYFSELAKDLHITRTANRLFISQQTLSNHIQRLEDYYGAPLLHRKPTLSLTYAGEFVLAFANVVNREQTNLRDILSDVAQQERGVLRFGASPLRMNTCLPNILPQFSAQYPNVELRIIDALSATLEPMVLDGELDLAIVLAEDVDPKLVERHLMEDQVYLCVDDALLRRYYGDKTDSIKKKAFGGIEVSDFSNLPICMNSSRMGERIMAAFQEKKITPKSYITSADTQISLSVCCKGLAACFASHMRLIMQQSSIPESINIFPLYNHGVPMTQNLSLIWRKDRYLSHYAKLFMDLLFRYFSEVEHIHMERMV